MEKQTLTRQELYDLVWSTPLSTLAKKYLISNVGLRKICIKMRIPLPASGHWVRVQFNRSVKKFKLPQKHSGKNEVTLGIREEGELLAKGKPSPIALLRKEILATEGNNLIVPDKLTNPCEPIIQAKKSIVGRKPDYFTHLTRCSYLNIEVSIPTMDRALRFMDTFIKVMENRGHQINHDGGLSCIVIQGEKMRIRCSERLNKTLKSGKPPFAEYIYSPSGILLFSAIVRWDSIYWVDGKLPLEEQLAKIIARLEINGEKLKQERIEREAYWAKERAKKHRKELKQKRKQRELFDFLAMLKEYRRWHEAELLREFIDRKEAATIKNNALTEKTKKRILWAREKIDWYDPFVASKDKYLGYYEKHNLPSLKDFKKGDDEDYAWNF